MASNGWERHRETILNLYCREGMQLAQVVSHMRQEHNFARSEDSYLKKFKEWHIQKKIGNDTWQYIAHITKKRGAKRTEITLCGLPLSHTKVQRGIKRYNAIPTADKFGKRLPSPTIPDGMIIDVQTPPILEPDFSWPSSLPWFCFKNRVLRELHSPTEFLRAFFNASTPYQEVDVKMPYSAMKNTLELHQAVIRLCTEVPEDPLDRQRKADALARNEFPPCLVAEMLKVIFFRLSNKTDTIFYKKCQVAHDQFILQLVHAVSRSNSRISAALFSGKCATTRAIKEAVYGSAIREKDYNLVEKLLKSGVNPELLVNTHWPPQLARRVFQRGVISLVWESYFLSRTGLQEAAITHDIRLAKIMLRAGATVNNGEDCLLELAAYASELASQYDDSIDLVELLVTHGARVDSFARPRHYDRCGTTVSLLFALAIASKKNRLAEFLTRQGAIEILSDYPEILRPSWEAHETWRDETMGRLDIPYTPGNIAIILGNQEIIERMLQPLLSAPKRSSLQTIKRLLLVSCLAGDTDTALRLLRLEDTYIDLNEQWPNDVTPLAASAWNPDTRIAEALLDLGASVGPTAKEEGSQTSALYPIHVAAFHGNTNLLRQLINRGANCNIRFKANEHPRDSFVAWALAPIVSSRPLQFSHESKNADTIRLLLSHLDLLDGDSHDDNLISDLISKGTNKSADKRPFGKTAFEAAIRIGSEKLIRHYFSSGDTYSSKAYYLATEVALKSKDYSILKLLAENRHTAQIDSFEASSLVLAIIENQWDIILLLLGGPFLPGTAKSFYSAHDLHFLPYHSEMYPDDRGIGARPLSVAVCSGNISILEAMIRRGYIPQAGDAAIAMSGGIGKHRVSDTMRAAFFAEFPPQKMDFASRAAVVYDAIISGEIKRIQEAIAIIESLDIPIKEDNLGPYTHTYSPLEVAADHGQMEIVSFLVNSGANPNASRPDQSTALELAAGRDNLEIVEYLLNRINVINPSIRRTKTSKALFLAAGNGNLKMATLLIEAGADVNIIPYGQRPCLLGITNCTPLQAAAHNGRLDMAELLLKNDAQIDKSMRIYYVRSIAFATMNGHFAVADYLKQRGSWGQNDQLLHDCLADWGALNLHPWHNDPSKFRYDENTDIWVIKNRWNDNETSIPPLMQHHGHVDSGWSQEWLDRSTPHDEHNDSYHDGDNISDDEVGEVELTMQRSGETVHMSQTWHNTIGCITPTALNNPAMTIATATNHYPASFWQIGGNRAIPEIEDLPEMDTVIEQTALQCSLEMDGQVPAVGYIVDEDIEDHHMLDMVGLCGPREPIPETSSLFDFDSSTDTPDNVCLDNPMPSLRDPATGIEWPLAGARGLDDASENFGNFSFPTDEVPQFDMLDVIDANGQSMLPCAEDSGWEGPFTHAGEIDDMNDIAWNFPIEEVPFDLS